MHPFWPNIPTEFQVQDWTCSVRSLTWCLKSIGVDIEASDVQDLMVNAGLINSELGLLDGSGSGIVGLLNEHFGILANARRYSFDELLEKSGKSPILMGGARWNHWVAVRGSTDGYLDLANPALGPHYGQTTIGAGNYEALGPFSVVTLENPSEAPSVDSEAVASPVVPVPTGNLVVTGTDGEGLVIRSFPGADGTKLDLVPDGTVLNSTGRSWTPVITQDGINGWCATEFLKENS